jgi:hypothetical protein
MQSLSAVEPSDVEAKRQLLTKSDEKKRFNPMLISMKCPSVQLMLQFPENA